MLITKIEELRLASPAHALDSLDGLAGTLDNSEHDFLKDKLGTPLYNALCSWYEQNQTHSDVITPDIGYYNHLLLLAQRCIAFDTLARAIGTQIVSVHNSGVNVPTAEDYEKPRKEDIDTYRQTCNQEAHAALNRLLSTLEEWTQESSAVSPQASEEQQQIVDLWRQSRYFYLAAQLIIPSAVVLQRYLNFYESREKFIQMLPDLQFIQEEILQPALGDDFTTMIVNYAVDGTTPTTESNEAQTPNYTTILDVTLHKLRRVMAALLAGRTSVLHYTKEQKIQFHDDGVRMLQTVITYIRNHQDEYPEAIIETSPLYVAPAPTEASEAQPTPPSGCPPYAPSPTVSVPGGCASSAPEQEAACWTPPLF